MVSTSVETGKMSVDIPIDDLNSFAINEGEELSLSFSLSHMHHICLYSKIAPHVDVFLRADYPIRLMYRLSNEEGLGGARIVFYLAPKISDD